jgi:hypothetical protein
VSKPRISPVKVEFVGIMPTLFAHCEHCMEVMHDTGMKPYSEQLEQYPEDVKKQYFELSGIAQKLRAEFGDAIYFDPIDAVSPQGIWLTMKYRILKTPCVIIQGKKTFNKLPTYEELRQKVLESLSVLRASA